MGQQSKLKFVSEVTKKEIDQYCRICEHFGFEYEIRNPQYFSNLKALYSNVDSIKLFIEVWKDDVCKIFNMKYPCCQILKDGNISSYVYKRHGTLSKILCLFANIHNIKPWNIQNITWVKRDFISNVPAPYFIYLPDHNFLVGTEKKRNINCRIHIKS